MVLSHSSKPPLYSIGCVITPHGFGHAARITAIMEALSDMIPVHYTIITTVPRWFFEDSLCVDFTYIPFYSDIGLVQKSSLEIDFQATIHELKTFYPPSPAILNLLRKHIRGCDLVLCDISPLGLLAAKEESIPSVLIENFTWDWIYRAYISQYPDFKHFADYQKSIFDDADFHIQTDPVCQPSLFALQTGPISRKTRTSPSQIRTHFHIPDEKKLVLITMGGIGKDQFLTTKLKDYPEVVFLAPGLSEQNQVIQDNLILLPKDSGLHHPDLVEAADVVIGKTGYSTLAEIYNGGVVWGYISRNDFPESLILSNFITNNMSGLEISVKAFHSGTWVEELPSLLRLPGHNPANRNGSQDGARFITAILSAL
ncbi:MAG: hypothetical protein OEM02_16550 [Desulfobulbaceae bacterium]|nr:hypothetical protein [Desulfobulbaceae bacterium]